MMTVYCFDIDGTICTDTDGAYEKAEPFLKIIDKINQLNEIQKNTKRIIDESLVDCL